MFIHSPRLGVYALLVDDQVTLLLQIPWNARCDQSPSLSNTAPLTIPIHLVCVLTENSLNCGSSGKAPVLNHPPCACYSSYLSTTQILTLPQRRLSACCYCRAAPSSLFLCLTPAWEQVLVLEGPAAFLCRVYQWRRESWFFCIWTDQEHHQ